MRTVSIPKRNGTYRTIVIPDAKAKMKLRIVGDNISQIVSKLPTAAVIHGFAHGRSPVTCALSHVGYAYTLSFDLQDFFESVTREKLTGKISAEDLDAVLYEGRAAQGLPSSPAAANLAAAALDRAILRAIDKAQLKVVYTRYADDLTFSFENGAAAAWLRSNVPQIVKRCGFKINAGKTTSQMARAGRRIITGIAVDDTGIYPSREIKRRLRAARHAGNAPQARGLEEWCQLKSPRARTASEVQGVSNTLVARQLARYWNLGSLPKFAAKPEERDGDLIITGDAAYVLGMSSYTTGWRSCMSQPDGEYRRGVGMWLALEGTRVAALLGKSESDFGGVKRRNMRARALVHRMRTGEQRHDRIYGDIDSANILKTWLEARGIRELSRGAGKVVGSVPVGKRRPYCDTLTPRRMRKDDRPVWVFEV